MPPSSAGSPKTRANTNAIRPATSPASIPRTSSERTMVLPVLCRSVAGEGEQVPAVVDELVDHLAREDRRGPLVHPDEVQEGEQDHAGEHRPRSDLPEGD